MSSDPLAIQFQNVSKYFTLAGETPQTILETLISTVSRKPKQERRQVWAVNDLSFDIQQGETVGFIGTNGSGKSTILKLATQIIYPSAGTVSVRGRVSALLELGAGFHPDLTGRENVFLNGSLLGLTASYGNRNDLLILDAQQHEYSHRLETVCYQRPYEGTCVRDASTVKNSFNFRFVDLASGQVGTASLRAD